MRGTIGQSSADGGNWYCPWHNEVKFYDLFPSREHFEELIDDRKAHGETRWDSRTRDAWWNLAQGIAGIGGWDYRKTEDDLVDDRQEVPGY